MKPATAMVLAFLRTRGLDGATEAECRWATGRTRDSPEAGRCGGASS